MPTDPNARRVFLVNKLIDVGLSKEEDAELDRLQREARFVWTKSGFEARQTVKKFSEGLE